MDEYYNIAMLTQFKNRMFDIPSELENLISKKLKYYCKYKSTDIQYLKDTLYPIDINEMPQRFEKVEKNYIEKAKKISKIENDSILSVQDTALDQLKLIL